uniref:Reverse transcriptase domain-containing protein n=1 Tax=Tanacetum cinerariifolium TaxID=118510 RepID=A0A6L2LKK9_TANCI|nr:hypothetical protein [Tanacetum cinerariifolium]
MSYAPKPRISKLPQTQQELIPSPSQVESTLLPSPNQSPIAQPSSPPLQQSSQPKDISHSAMALLNQLLETCATLTKKVNTLEQDKIAQAIEITNLKKVGTAQIVESSTDTVMDDQEDGRLPKSQAYVYHLDLEHAQKVLSMQETNEVEHAKVEEVIEVVTAAKLIMEVVTTVAATTIVATTITIAPMPKASALRRRRGKGILVEKPKPLKRQAQIEQDEAYARELEAELNANINWNDVIEQVKIKERQDNTVMRYQYLKRKPITEEQARKSMMVYLKNMAGFKMDFFKGMTYTKIRPIFKKHFNSIWAFLEKGEKEIEEEESKESKRKSESSEQK